MDLANYQKKIIIGKNAGKEVEKKQDFCFEDNFFVIHERVTYKKEYELSLKLAEGLLFGDRLRSWIIPKNIPLEKEVKHLAIRIIDASLNWAKFEGVIPKGSPRAGVVKIWDCGRFGMLQGSLDQGRISLNLFGKKVMGRYVFKKVRLDDRLKNNNWLIWKRGNY